MGKNEEEVRAIVREELKEIVVRMLAYLSMPKPEEETEPEQADLFTDQEPEKPKRITFRHGITVKFIEKPERYYRSEKDFAEEITNGKIPTNFRSHQDRSNDHQHLIQINRKRLDKLLADTGSILKIEYIRKTTPDGQEYEA